MAVSQSLTLTESDIDVASNTSKVRIVWKSTQTGESWNGYARTAKYYISINGGAETEYSVSYKLPKDSTVIIAQPTITVTHKGDGSGTVKVRTWMDTDISAGVVEQTKSLTLATIPRASTLDSISCSTAYFDGTITYKYTPQSNIFYNQCVISLKVGEDYKHVYQFNLGKKSAALQTETFKFTSDILAKIYNMLGNAVSSTLRFNLGTYVDSEYTNRVGNIAYKDITLTIPFSTDVTPSATLTLTPVTDVTTEEAVYIKGISKVKCVFSNVTAKYGATITKYSFNVTGKNVETTQGSYTSDYLTTTGTVRVTAVIYDSRGRYTSWSREINVLDYTTPTIDSLTCSTSYFNGTITYKYRPVNAVFYSRCVISLGDTTIKTISHGKRSDAQQTATVTFSASELSAIYNKLPSSAEGKLRFTFRAYSDSAYSKQVGADSYREITLSIPETDETRPEATLSLTPVSIASKESLKTLYIRGKTRVKAILSDGDPKYGASIASYKVTIGGRTENSPYTFDWLSTMGDVTITGTVTDSRGFSKTYTKKITVIDYASPRILPASGEDEVIAARCDAAGNLNANGIYLRIKAKRDYSRVVYSEDQKNFCAIEYRFSADGVSFSAWTTILEADASSDEVDTGAILGTLDVATSYVVQIRAVDDVGEVTTTSITVSTEKVYMHRAGSINALGIGKLAEDANTVDIAEDMTVRIRGTLESKETSDTGWVSLGLSSDVAATRGSTGRNGGGCFYRVVHSNHVYIAFNCSFEYENVRLMVNANLIPVEYRPQKDVFAMNPLSGKRFICRSYANSRGEIFIDWVQSMIETEITPSATVDWIDGYIDYWL